MALRSHRVSRFEIPALTILASFSARPWDSHNDISTYEKNFIICTRTRHHTHPSVNHCSSPSIDGTRENLHSLSNDDVPVALKRLETELIHAQARIQVQQKEIHHLQTHHAPVEGELVHFLTPYMQFMLLILVALALKYVFR